MISNWDGFWDGMEVVPLIRFSYLPFGEVEGCRYLDSSGSAQVLVEVEFFF